MLITFDARNALFTAAWDVIELVNQLWTKRWEFFCAAKWCHMQMTDDDPGRGRPKYQVVEIKGGSGHKKDQPMNKGNQG